MPPRSRSEVRADRCTARRALGDEHVERRIGLDAQPEDSVLAGQKSAGLDARDVGSRDYPGLARVRARLTISSV